jgi:hypothetical protein
MPGRRGNGRTPVNGLVSWVRQRSADALGTERVGPVEYKEWNLAACCGFKCRLL